MDTIIEYFSGLNPVQGALYATLFTWGVTALGASTVFLFKTMSRMALDGMLGFTGGVMVAASFWSLLSPAIEMSAREGFVKVIAEEKTDKVLGVSIIGAVAGTMIAELALAMEFGASSEDIARTCHAHPTHSEAVKEAAMAIDKRSIHF